MARNRVQFQKGLSEAGFQALTGAEELCRAVFKLRRPDACQKPFVASVQTTADGRPDTVKLRCPKCFSKAAVKAPAEKTLLPTAEVYTDGLGVSSQRLARSNCRSPSDRMSRPRSRVRPSTVRPSTAGPRGMPVTRSAKRSANGSNRPSAGARPSAPSQRRCCAASSASNSSSR